MPIAVSRDPIYRRRRYSAEVSELCVRWYITYRPSYRDLVAMMAASISSDRFSRPYDCVNFAGIRHAS